MQLQQTNAYPITTATSQHDRLAESSDQRRVSETSASSFTSEQSEPYAEHGPEFSYNHAMMHNPGMFNASHQPHDSAGSYGDSEDANVPDLTDSEAQSLADEDADHTEQFVDSYDEIKLEADANGFLLPSQHFST